MFKRFRLAIVFLCIPLLLSACQFFGGKKTKDDQVLNLMVSQSAPSFDSAKSTDAVSFEIINSFNEGLLRNGKDGELVPAMAKDLPKVGKDGLTYTYEIRENALWSNGEPVTAHDFVYGWTRALDQKTASEYAFILYDVKNAKAFNQGKASRDQVGVKALDDKTLQVTLEKPLAYFNDLTVFATFFPQNQKFVETCGADYALKTDKLLYNGPFVMTEWKQNSVKLIKNDKYWEKDVVKLKEINYNVVGDTGTAEKLFKTGKLDVVPSLDAEYIDQYHNSPDKLIIKEAVTSYIEMNEVKCPMFKSKKIRQAMSLAIDRNALMGVLKNGSVVAGGFVPPTIKAFDGTSYRDAANNAKQHASVEYNPALARKLWEEGLKELGMKNPSQIELKSDNHSAAKKTAEFLQAQLNKNLGANFIISAIPYKQRLQDSDRGDFETVVSLWGADYNDPNTFMNLFMSTQSFNHGKWINKDFDRLIAAAEHNPNLKKRTKMYIEAEKILTDDTGVVLLYHRNKFGLKKPYVDGIVWNIAGPANELKWASINVK